jgi:ribosomal protein L32
MWEYGAMLGILIVVGYWVFHPLFRPSPLASVSPPEGGDRDKILQRSKEDVYAAIKEMDFDREMGKISDEDYRELRAQYAAKAVAILRESERTKAAETDVESAIEKEVQRLRGKETGKRKTKKSQGSAHQINFCPQCGKKVAPRDRFCQGCGMNLGSPWRSE